MIFGTKCEAAADAQNAIGLGLAFAALGNVMGLIEPPRDPPRSWSGSGTILSATSLLYAEWATANTTDFRRLGRADVLRRLADVGLTSRNLKGSLAAGALVGLVLGIPGLAVLVLPENWFPSVKRTRQMRLLPALRFICGQLLLSTAASEELAFRGILHHRLRVSFQPRDAVLLSSLFFALWHAVFNARTLAAMGVTNKLWFGLASVLQMVSVYVGGVTFAMLREKFGTLAGCIVAHWLTDILLNARFLIRPPGFRRGRQS